MNDRYEDMYQAAARYYVQDETMESIARALRLSRSSVSRLLKEARESGMVRISLADHHGSSSPMATALSQIFGDGNGTYPSGAWLDQVPSSVPPPLRSMVTGRSTYFCSSLSADTRS